ncbi:MAG TPA: prolipoprotein diacylglyceryl transferase [Polyangia bacterium]|jgi:phosphatidylglycerol:prolipoprotein diacylglycerol transferase|nr:prolipoprotein diacylglyceryl transferase [Polyangia bacterium]
MRPILINIPSKALLVVLLALAVAAVVRDLVRRRREPKTPWSSTPLYLLAGAEILLGLKSGSWVPAAAGFAQPWTPVPIYAYGVMLGTSLIVGWFLAMRFAKQDGVRTEDAGALYMWSAVWSIIGARLLYVFTNLSDFERLTEVFMVNRGGLVAYGGMIGGFLASWYGCRKRKVPLLQWADMAAPSVVLGTAITRVGCLLFGCDFGGRSDLPWAITFPGPSPMSPNGSPAWQHHVQDFGLPRDALQSYPVHPTQIYESLVGLFLFGVLMLLRRRRTFSGQVFLGWVLGYGSLRPLIELVRDDGQRGSVGPLSTSQFIGIVTVGLGLALLVYLIRRHRKDPQSLRLWEQPAFATGVAGPASSSGDGGRGPGGKRRKRR